MGRRGISSKRGHREGVFGVFFLAALALLPRSVLANDRVSFAADTSLRYDFIDVENLPNTGTALTLRGAVEGEWRITDWLNAAVEIEGVAALIDDYTPSPMMPLQRPFIPDPENLEFNKIQIQAKLHDDAFLNIGRLKLEIDDLRFIGSAPFRQNRQSFDGAAFTFRSASSHTLKLGYFSKVNRPLGTDSMVGAFQSQSWFANTNLQTRLGRVGLFHYALDLETANNWTSQERNNTFSSATTGIRFDGRYHRGPVKADLELSFAHQSDFADNPHPYQAQYGLIDTRFFLRKFEVSARYERLGADEFQSFQTPLAALHKFHGEADVFLQTPARGLEDASTLLRFNGGRFGPLTDLTPVVRLHHFRATRGDDVYGQEIDFILRAKMKKFGLKLALAHFEGDTGFATQQRVFLSLNRKF